MIKIKSSEESWETAANALKLETGGYLHIHGNVDIKKKSTNYSIHEDWVEWSEYAANKIKLLLDKRDTAIKWKVRIDHIEYVKSYGPRVDHLVLDLICKPE